MKYILITFLPLILGILFIVKAQAIAKGFCAFGKWIWRVSTFGATDMGAFYQVDKTASTFKLFGVIFIAWSVLLVGIGAHAYFLG